MRRARDRGEQRVDRQDHQRPSDAIRGVDGSGGGCGRTFHPSMTAVLPETHGLSPDQLLEIDYYLRLTRTLEERLVALFRQAKVIGGLYRSLGQEGESVAAAYALDYKQGDVVQPLIRNLGSILVAGAKPVDVLKQYMAKGDSPTRGRA